jgi:hypothetical protein
MDGWMDGAAGSRRWLVLVLVVEWEIDGMTVLVMMMEMMETGWMADDRGA